MRQLRIHPAAQFDLREIRNHLVQQNKDLLAARRVESRLFAKLESLASLSFQLGTLVPEYGVEGLRRFPAGNFNLFLRYSEDTLDVLAITWGGQDTRRIFSSRKMT